MIHENEILDFLQEPKYFINIIERFDCNMIYMEKMLTTLINAGEIIKNDNGEDHPTYQVKPKTTYVVRVVQGKKNDEIAYINKAFLESLRYAGLITVHEVDPNGLTNVCFDLLPPHGVNDKVWAEQNAERMRSFGFNAVKAPKA